MSTHDLAGELAVHVQVRDGAVYSVRIDSTRPQLADRLLKGKPADEAVADVPRLFSICGGSQHVAAQLALQAARGEATSVDAAQIRRVEAEMAQEYLWRALIDWAREVGRAPADDTLAAARKFAQSNDRGALRALVERDVLGTDAQQWYEHEHVPAFEIWIARASTVAARFLADVQRDGPRHGASSVPLLPAFDQGDTAQRLVASLAADPAFERAPHWNGQPAETGAIARMREHPLVAAMSAAFGRSTLVRFAARLTELARLACDDPAPAPLAGGLALVPGRGLGWVETARGLLLHAIELDGGRIAHYRIVAPTEWNFHADGPVKGGLAGVHELSAADLRRRAEWLVQSLDPCVTYRLQIDHA